MDNETNGLLDQRADTNYVMNLIDFRIFWLAIIITAFGLFTFMLSKNIMKLLSYPVSVDIRDEYKESLDFPAVTICNENRFR